MTKVLELEPSNDQARRNIVRLKPLADEKREKMKEEMIGKLAYLMNLSCSHVPSLEPLVCIYSLKFILYLNFWCPMVYYQFNFAIVINSGSSFFNFFRP